MVRRLANPQLQRNHTAVVYLAPITARLRGVNRLFWTIFALPVLTLAQDADKPEVIAATEVDTLKAKAGETLTVRGFIDRTGRSGSGINFLNFKDSDFVAVVFGQHVAKFEDGAPHEMFDAKWVEVTGKVEIYKENPQIKIEDQKQIKIVEAPKSEPTASAPAAADPEPTPEPVPEPAPTPPAPKPAVVNSDLEVVNGKPAVDWKLYFSE